jgi:hypothetical protein
MNSTLMLRLEYIKAKVEDLEAKIDKSRQDLFNKINDMEQRLINMLKDVKGVNLSPINQTITSEEPVKEKAMPLYAKNLDEEVETETDLYPGTNIRRAFVPESKIMWDVNYPSYKPVRFTSPKILSNSNYDVDILK